MSERMMPEGKRSFEDRHESTKTYIDYMRPRCVELHRVLKKTGSFYYHCGSHASHYVKVMLDQISGAILASLMMLPERQVPVTL